MHPTSPSITLAYPVERELSLRAVSTGIVIGILLTPSNVYAGLKIGWSFNMSIIALLIGYGIWQGLAKRATAQLPWTLHESNINQTVASAAASIISGGLVAPIPAYTLLTGQQLDVIPMVAWVFSVSFLGIWIAWYLRPSLLNDKALKFPEGMATLETLLHIYNHGHEAAKRLKVLLSAALLSGWVKGVDTFLWTFPRWSPTPQLERLTFTADPSLLLVGFGAIIGIRVGLTLLLGALLAWGGLAPWLLAQGLVQLPPGSSGPQFAALVEWLLWPGVSLMVCATLTSLAIRLWALHKSTRAGGGTTWVAPKTGPAAGFLLAIILVVSLQTLLFGINPWMALLTIPLAVCLAAVAARVVGATGIAPIGAIGQLSQLSFGIVAPGQVPINLMSANTAGGSAGQCTDLMNDFKVGRAIGATPGKQLIAQTLGIFVGSIVGVLAYLALIPDPQGMLLTQEWPAPAVATWKAVAQTLTLGLDSLSASIRWAVIIGAVAGLLLGILDSVLPAHRARYLPSTAALGLAFVLPASVSLMMALGAVLTWLVSCRWPSLTERFAITAAAGLIAGESITGVGASLWQMVGNGG
ncbi:OPT family oligopeptide transporter [Pseudomonas fluorescens]|uniref:OPT/YSL family transporter n=1 Tax=Pseudomonas fluorescens TaxID=294 RepID=A0A944HAL8_PSEFL|nr:OPT family oligopeptide transporter [Pseudomonas fluorescens]MBT2297521.1 OPT/YSL family transporter [Pseudomonas fluorescens]MBT2305719.1 OPT/YSL family transporter [Pseudomonas fluorescens]MBT2314258.1 OPT/YSL family transporter [Pseudomonas fluorescens]MBT2319250.1 OPT/YSL family transporter [Pseudomonas fluorescens]MBT2327460.1 OPT/YSL family transporter [Pseudomonas fluorescens]